MFNMPLPSPQRLLLEGRYTRLEPLEPGHTEQLFTASAGVENQSRFDYLFEYQPKDLADTEQWIAAVNSADDKLYFAVIDVERKEPRYSLVFNY